MQCGGALPECCASSKRFVTCGLSPDSCDGPRGLLPLLRCPDRARRGDHPTALAVLFALVGVSRAMVETGEGSYAAELLPTTSVAEASVCWLGRRPRRGHVVVGVLFTEASPAAGFNFAAALSDARVVRQDHPPPAQPRRRPPSQPRALADRAVPHELRAPHPRLRRAAPPRGKSKMEIIRCLKRYVAREVYPLLQEQVAD